MVSGAKQDVEKSDIYEQAWRLSEENTEESLEQAMLLYQSIRGWQDADAPMYSISPAGLASAGCDGWWSLPC